MCQVEAKDGAAARLSENTTNSHPKLDKVEAPLVEMASLAEVDSFHSQYSRTEWYGDIYNYLTSNTYPTRFDRLQRRAFLHKVSAYELLWGELFVNMRGVKKGCITKDEVAEVLRAAHDKEGHFAKEITLRKLRQYFWPGMAQDTEDYIAGCMKCAVHGIAADDGNRHLS
jgi:hypothetical protein